MTDPAHVIRLLIFAVIIFSFLRRIGKVRTTNKVPPRTTQRPPSTRKNDFRDAPPPPENPELG